METVGKTYMAAAGLPETRKDHAHAAAELTRDVGRLALLPLQHHSFYLPLRAQMLDLARKCVLPNGEPLNIRIGIHTGEFPRLNCAL